MTTTKQAAAELKKEAWAARKELDRQLRKEPRGVSTTIAEPRLKTLCTCQHSPKHHTKTGRCRPGCDCKAGVRR